MSPLGHEWQDAHSTSYQPVSTMLQYRLYNGHQIPAGLQGVLKGSANIGSMFGQLGFGASINAASPLVMLIDACALR